MFYLKRLYDYVLSWAERKHAPTALSVISFAEASFFPIPPDPLLVALCLGKPRRSLWFAVICSAFSVLGAVFGYLIGWGIWEHVNDFFFDYILKEQAFEYVQDSYQSNAFLALLGAAFTPIPFKVFTIAAGVFKVNFLVLIIASALGRSARFFLEAVLILYYGPRIKDFIEKYFNILTLAAFLVFVILVLIFRS